MLRSFLFIIGNEVAIEVGNELLNSEDKDITDEDITQNIKERLDKNGIDFEPDDPETLKLNTVRKTLYKLYSAKLAQFRRIRDKSTGWFIYYWWHEFDMIEEILIEKKKKKLKKEILIEKKKKILRKLRERLQFEETNYFFLCKECKKQNVKYDFDEAFELNFRCPDCGGSLEAQDNQKIIEFLKKQIVLNDKAKIIVEP